MRKRRAIVDSGSYHLWSITWDDLEIANSDHVMVAQVPIAQKLEQFAQGIRGQVQALPDARKILRNGMQQFLAFLEVPHAPGWSQLATVSLVLAASRPGLTGGPFRSSSLSAALAALAEGQRSGRP